MKINISEIMRNARTSLQGKWGIAIATSLVSGLILGSYYFLYVNGANRGFWDNRLGNSDYTDVFSAVDLLLGGPIALGLSIFSLAIVRGQSVHFLLLFEGFKRWISAFLTYIVFIITIALWSLLLIIPGIIAAFSYSMTFYVVADDEHIGVMDALAKSKKMMDGHKWQYFDLLLRFIGLALLCILTLGIGFLWLAPYWEVCNATFYEALKAEEKGEVDVAEHLLVPELD